VLRFLIGFVVALATVAGGAYLYFGKSIASDACLGRCGDATICTNARCAPLPVVPPVSEPKSGHRHRRPLLNNNGVGQAEPEKKLQPGDERIVTTGDALGRPEHIDMTKPDEKELDQGEIDRVWASAEPKLSRCITEAVADWPLEGGKIEVSYRIERDGSVRKVRLVAPSLLLRNGLYACMRDKVVALRFSQSGGANVVTFPFQLQ
jgi:hypothetical protein